MSSTNIIHLCVGRSQLSGGGAYLDRVVALAYEQGFPLYCLDMKASDNGTVDRNDRRVFGLRQEQFDDMIYHIRGCCENANKRRDMATNPYQLMKETCESKLGRLLGCYRNMLKIKSEAEPDMHRTLCCFLRLELDFFLSLRNSSTRYRRMVRHYRRAAEVSRRTCEKGTRWRCLTRV